MAEGEDLLAAADAAGWEPVERYCAAGSGLPGTEVEPKLLAAASELGSGTRTLAVYEERWAPAATGPLCVYLHGVGDPGNVGTVLRSAEAFGAASVAIGPGTADPFGPKAVRASMGAVFTVPLARATTLADLPGAVALDAVAPRPARCARARRHDHPARRGRARGAAGGRHLGVNQVSRIPIVNHSLNAAMAATVALYELLGWRADEQY